MYRKILGVLRLFFHLLNANFRDKIAEIVNILVNDQPAIKEKVFVLMVGYSKVGKTSFVNKNERLKTFFNISTNSIHNLLNNTFAFLKDDNTVYGSAYWERQYLTRIVRKRLLNEALKKVFAVVNDSANLNRKERKARLKIAKRYGYETIIVWVTCPEEELLARLQKADNELILNGQKPAWVNLYTEVQKNRFDPPLDNEADTIIRIVCSGGDTFY